MAKFAVKKNKRGRRKLMRAQNRWQVRRERPNIVRARAIRNRYRTISFVQPTRQQLTAFGATRPEASLGFNRQLRTRFWRAK